MRAFRRTVARGEFLLAVAVVWLALSGWARTAPVWQPAVPAGSVAGAAGQASGYVGEATCITCHDTQGESLKGTPHARKNDPRSPAGKFACESCHGPGKAHVDADGDKTKIKVFTTNPGDATATCVTCHNRGEHALWNGSTHERRKVGCLTCHSVHSGKSVTGQLKTETQAKLCAQCHRDKIAKLDRSGHMPVREGKLECTSCHNTHGSQNVRLLRVGTSVNEACWSCHPEKRGPFLWEHAPTRESCVTCHDPHGSANERMLVARLPFLCQRCHAHTRHPATIYDAVVMQSSNRVYGRACVNCHSAIHGSNHPSGMAFHR